MSSCPAAFSVQESQLPVFLPHQFVGQKTQHRIDTGAQSVPGTCQVRSHLHCVTPEHSDGSFKLIIILHKPDYDLSLFVVKLRTSTLFTQFQDTGDVFLPYHLMKGETVLIVL